ncbi:hypothetical protein HZA41_01655 [Candidatus Peregrinibacteria bacterium]|nr:hypothetical protein [Candidatus Peregrinibacteria bacterium]
MKFETEELDYARFYRYLNDKYRPEAVYVFIGFVGIHQPLYDFLKRCGYKLVFKETLQNKDGEIKGNVDAELIVQYISTTYLDDPAIFKKIKKTPSRDVPLSQ